jgi:SAM-dependent methyltransferase
MTSNGAASDVHPRDRFDAAALDYEASRPGYPHELLRRLDPAGETLEIGCGTGQLTVDLLRRGHEVVAVDSGQQLLARARERSTGAEFVLGRFEDIDLGRRAFDLVVAAAHADVSDVSAVLAAIEGPVTRAVGAGRWFSAAEIHWSEWEQFLGASELVASMRATRCGRTCHRPACSPRGRAARAGRATRRSVSATARDLPRDRGSCRRRVIGPLLLRGI